MRIVCTHRLDNLPRHVCIHVMEGEDLRVYISAPQSKNAVSTFQITCRVLFFCLGKLLKWLADDQSSSITKGSIYYINYMNIQPFSMKVDWKEIWHQMDVCSMFYICRYCVLLCGADIKWLVTTQYQIVLLNSVWNQQDVSHIIEQNKVR